MRANPIYGLRNIVASGTFLSFVGKEKIEKDTMGNYRDSTVLIDILICRRAVLSSWISMAQACFIEPQVASAGQSISVSKIIQTEQTWLLKYLTDLPIFFWIPFAATVVFGSIAVFEIRWPRIRHRVAQENCNRLLYDAACKESLGGVLDVAMIIAAVR